MSETKRVRLNVPIISYYSVGVEIVVPKDFEITEDMSLLELTNSAENDWQFPEVLVEGSNYFELDERSLENPKNLAYEYLIDEES